MAAKAPARPPGAAKSGRPQQISGTKPSVHNNSLLISTGVPSLDYFLGGGMAVGTMLLLDEDKYRTYSNMLFRYFIAEGVMCKQINLVASADCPPDDILSDLPQDINYNPASTNPETGGDNLEIAWRYGAVKSSENVNSVFGHYYDVTKSMGKEQIEQCRVHTFDPHTHPVTGEDNSCSLDKLLKQVEEIISSEKLKPNPQHRPRDLLRIGISGLGSSYWDATLYQINTFLFKLKALLRSSFSAAFVTIPAHLFQNISSFVKISDTALQLISFADHSEEYKTNPAFKEYHGLMKIHKLPRINSLTSQIPDTMDWVFKLKRKYFLIQRMHLPPDLSETVSRSQEDVLSCRPGPGKSKSNLDF